MNAIFEKIKAKVSKYKASQMHFKIPSGDISLLLLLK